MIIYEDAQVSERPRPHPKYMDYVDLIQPEIPYMKSETLPKASPQAQLKWYRTRAHESKGGRETFQKLFEYLKYNYHQAVAVACVYCVYAFMRLWGGLIFRNGFRVVSPPVAGGAARFPSLKTVKTVTSPAMLTPPRPTLITVTVTVTGNLLNTKALTLVSRLLSQPVQSYTLCRRRD